MLKMRIYHLMAFALLLSLMFYSYTNHSKHYPTISDFLREPAKYDGIVTEQQGKSYNITDDSFIFRSGSKYVLVKYPGVEEPKYGHITFVGAFKKEGYIEATRVRYNNYNYGKYLFSFIGAFLLLFMLFKEWKLTWGGFEDA